MTPTPGALEARLESLFPGEVAVAAERITPASDKMLWPEERSAVAGAVPGRLAEFVAGRTAARRALSMLGHPAVALPMALDRAAVWPKGIAGSISHAAGFAVAVARPGAPVGIDIEADEDISPDLWPILCVAEELRLLPPDQAGRRVKRLFCAKEAVFKAQSPDRRAMFGHEALSVTLAENHFNAQFLTSIGAFRAGQIVRGRIDVAGGLILAGVAV